MEANFETSIPKVATNVVAKNVDENIVLVTPRQGKVRVLNGVGSVVWSLIDGRRSLHDICDSLMGEFKVDREVASADLHTFITEMNQYGLVTLDA